MLEPVAEAPELVAPPEDERVAEAAADEEEEPEEESSMVVLPHWELRACSQLNCSAALPSPLAPMVALMQVSYQ